MVPASLVEKNLGILPELGARLRRRLHQPDIALAFLAPLTSMAKSLSDGAPRVWAKPRRDAARVPSGKMSVLPAWKAPAVTTVRAFDANFNDHHRRPAATPRRWSA